MTEQAVAPTCSVRSRLRGGAFGVRQPALVITLSWPAHVNGQRWGALHRAFDPLSAVVAVSRDAPLLAARNVLALIVGAQRAAGLPVFDEGKVMRARQVAATSDGSSGSSANPVMRQQAVLLVPYSPSAPKAALLAAQHVIDVLNAHDAPTSIEPSAQNLLIILGRMAPKGKNTMHFLRAAHRLGMPWDQVAAGCYQYGWGAASCLMDSSFTEHTSTIGAALARNKHLAAEVLRRAGLPAPPHAFARDVDQALRIAQELGYPVVVKPGDLDGGIGVAAGLRNEASVRRAFAAAAQHSKQILVEKHFVGRDYRMLVFRGQLVSAVLRQPGGVTGNGVDDIATLIAIVNQNREPASPGREGHAEAGRALLTIDEEANALLAEQGVTLASVPVRDVFVQLRRAANVAMGGRSIAALSLVHADNRALAEQAAAALNLDLAGVDLIIPDVAVSWRVSGAAICEVNSQPQFGVSTQRHLHGQILQALTSRDGRIPTVVVVGEDNAAFIAKLSDKLKAEFSGIGVASSAGAWINGQQLGATNSVFDGARALLFNRKLTLLVLDLADSAVTLTGLPLDQFDVLVVASHLPNKDALMSVLQAIAAHCRGDILVSSQVTSPLASDDAVLSAVATRDGRAAIVVDQSQETCGEVTAALVDAVLVAVASPHEETQAGVQHSGCDV